MAEGMLKPVLLAGSLLCLMSIIDTLAYGVRTAGVVTRKLALSLTLFNALALVSRMGNMVSAPVLGNFPDKVYQGQYSADQVLNALRICLYFVVGGVVIGALLMPSMIALFSRGISVLEEKGTLPRTIWHALRNPLRVLQALRPVNLLQLKHYGNFGVLPRQFLIYNVFVTCFYSLGVISTVQAASLDHSVASTAILLSGIVNGLATLILFLIVDPPGAVVIEQCISGKRPLEHAKILNLALVGTRLLGTVLALLLLPLMAQYVLVVARWVDTNLAQGRTQEIASVKSFANNLEYELKVADGGGGRLDLGLRVHNPDSVAAVITFSTGSDFVMELWHADQVVWSSNAGTRSTQAVRLQSLPGHGNLAYAATIETSTLSKAIQGQVMQLQVRHLTDPPAQFTIDFQLPNTEGGTP